MSTKRAFNPGPNRFAVRTLWACLATLFVMAFLPTSAQAWWNEEWSLRKKIMVDASPTGAGITDTIGAVPVLVRLHVGNFRFGQAKQDGSDLRFVSGDDKTPLKYHIEKYDALLGEALVWVSMPDLHAGSKADIWLYYGNQKATSASDPKATYTSDTALVYHFGERGTPAQDASVWANHAQGAGQPADGSLIGTGLRLDGVTSVTIPATQSLEIAQDGALTWTAWIKPASLQRNAVIYSRREGSNGLVIGMDDGMPFVEISASGATHRSSAGAPVAPGGWHHLAVVATPGLVTLYLDGNAYASISGTIPALKATALLGGDTAVVTAAPANPAPVAAAPASEGQAAAPTTEPGAAAGNPSAGAVQDPGVQATPQPAPAAPVATTAAAMPGFVGDIDELMLIKAARPAGFIKALAVSQGTDPTKLIAFSPDEETASWLSGYFGVLIRAVTVDGWVVIGILLVMAVASWMVMVEKSGYLSRQRKANAEFLPRFRSLDSDLTALLADGASGDKAQQRIRRDASMLRLYRIGAEELRKRSSGTQPGRIPVLNAEAIASIRAALEAGLVREIQMLNRMMVILTISISGGPFLGLLGTVIGVMITFAAIAMSGDVNINAIAPGVAGALMATVAGLAVAIPALFAYNYLTLGIRDRTTEMQVFVEEFVTKMAEAFSRERPDPLQHRIAAE
ncbi:DUF2341 domain-containing protein [Hyphomicrobium sp. 2TAF46]|uniref:DUF2341 domain-containing protein n=1 Tax=Hyphomicrobium sp. 2TAF46 TaxID=3233019 RepID=UPI003F8DCFC0